MRAGPSGEERCTPHYTVPVSPQCPQEVSLLTLPVFQGAAVSSERFSQSLPPRNVAELGGSPPLRGSLEQLDRPSPAGPPFQGTELAALSTPEASLKRLVPLVGHPAAWEPLPSVSHWDLPGRLWFLVFLRDDVGLRTVISNRRLLRQSWCQGPGLVRAGPSGEEWCTPQYTVPVSPQCPQEISLLTLPVFQGAAVSSERFSQSLPPRNVAEMGGSPPLRGSLEQLDRPSPAGPPLQGTELAALSTPEASLKRLVPLVGHPAAWEPLPSVSHWDLPEQTLVPSLP